MRRRKVSAAQPASISIATPGASNSPCAPTALAASRFTPAAVNACQTPVVSRSEHSTPKTSRHFDAGLPVLSRECRLSSQPNYDSVAKRSDARGFRIQIGREYFNTQSQDRSTSQQDRDANTANLRCVRDVVHSFKEVACSPATSHSPCTMESFTSEKIFQSIFPPPGQVTLNGRCSPEDVPTLAMTTPALEEVASGGFSAEFTAQKSLDVSTRRGPCRTCCDHPVMENCGEGGHGMKLEGDRDTSTPATRTKISRKRKRDELDVIRKKEETNVTKNSEEQLRKDCDADDGYIWDDMKSSDPFPDSVLSEALAALEQRIASQLNLILSRVGDLEQAVYHARSMHGGRLESSISASGVANHHGPTDSAVRIVNRRSSSSCVSGSVVSSRESDSCRAPSKQSGEIQHDIQKPEAQKKLGCAPLGMAAEKRRAFSEICPNVDELRKASTKNLSLSDSVKVRRKGCRVVPQPDDEDLPRGAASASIQTRRPCMQSPHCRYGSDPHSGQIGSVVQELKTVVGAPTLRKISTAQNVETPSDLPPTSHPLLCQRRYLKRQFRATSASTSAAEHVSDKTTEDGSDRGAREVTANAAGTAKPRGHWRFNGFGRWEMACEDTGSGEKEMEKTRTRAGNGTCESENTDEEKRRKDINFKGDIAAVIDGTGCNVAARLDEEGKKNGDEVNFTTQQETEADALVVEDMQQQTTMGKDRGDVVDLSRIPVDFPFRQEEQEIEEHHQDHQRQQQQQQQLLLLEQSSLHQPGLQEKQLLHRMAEMMASIKVNRPAKNITSREWKKLSHQVRFLRERLCGVDESDDSEEDDDEDDNENDDIEVKPKKNSGIENGLGEKKKCEKIVKLEKQANRLLATVCMKNTVLDDISHLIHQFEKFWKEMTEECEIYYDEKRRKILFELNSIVRRLHGCSESDEEGEYDSRWFAKNTVSQNKTGVNTRNAKDHGTEKKKYEIISGKDAKGLKGDERSHEVMMRAETKQKGEMEVQRVMDYEFESKNQSSIDSVMHWEEGGEESYKGGAKEESRRFENSINRNDDISKEGTKIMEQNETKKEKNGYDRRELEVQRRNGINRILQMFWSHCDSDEEGGDGKPRNNKKNVNNKNDIGKEEESVKEQKAIERSKASESVCETRCQIISILSVQSGCGESDKPKKVGMEGKGKTDEIRDKDQELEERNRYEFNSIELSCRNKPDVDEDNSKSIAIKKIIKNTHDEDKQQRGVNEEKVEKQVEICYAGMDDHWGSKEVADYKDFIILRSFGCDESQDDEAGETNCSRKEEESENELERIRKRGALYESREQVCGPPTAEESNDENGLEMLGIDNNYIVNMDDTDEQTMTGKEEGLEKEQNKKRGALHKILREIIGHDSEDEDDGLDMPRNDKNNINKKDDTDEQTQKRKEEMGENRVERVMDEKSDEKDICADYNILQAYSCDESESTKNLDKKNNVENEKSDDDEDDDGGEDEEEEEDDDDSNDDDEGDEGNINNNDESRGDTSRPTCSVKMETSLSRSQQVGASSLEKRSQNHEQGHSACGSKDPPATECPRSWARDAVHLVPGSALDPGAVDSVREPRPADYEAPLCVWEPFQNNCNSIFVTAATMVTFGIAIVALYFM